MTRDELTEAVARGIDESLLEFFLQFADAMRAAKCALQAIEDAGMVVAPREATEAMVDAWVEASPEESTASLNDSDANRLWAWATAEWDAMIAAGRVG